MDDLTDSGAKSQKADLEIIVVVRSPGNPCCH